MFVFFSNCDILFNWLNFCEKSNLRWRIAVYSKKSPCGGGRAASPLVLCTRRLQSIFRQTTLFGLACGLHRTHPWERGCFYFKKNNLSRCSFAKITTRSIANKPHYRGGATLRLAYRSQFRTLLLRWYSRVQSFFTVIF